LSSFKFPVSHSFTFKQNNTKEKEAVIEEEEEKFWSAGLFGSGIAKQLLDTIYFYNGKMFGLRGQRKKINWQCS